MEDADKHRPGQAIDSEDLPVAERHTGAANEAGEALTEFSGQPNMGYSSPRRSDPSGRLLAVSTLVPQGEEADPFSSPTHGDGQDSQGGAAAHGVVERGGAGHAFPQSEAAGYSGAMDDRVEHQRNRNVDHTDGDDTVDAVDVDAGATADGPERQEPGERQEEEFLSASARNALRAALTNLVLDNSSHLCYANAAVSCFLWASLSRSSFSYADWGIPAPLFREMLSSPEPYSIDSQTWYEDLTLHCEDNHGQADSAEFTQMLVQWVSPAFYSSYWHRRWMQCENVLIHDHGDKYQPLLLQLEPTHVTNGMIRLTDMLRSWHGELGMSAGLLRPPDSFCVHLDRMVQTSKGAIYKMQTPIIFTGDIQVPVFQGSTLECRWELYQAVAAFARYGESKAGHYKALLRTEPGHVGLDATAYWLDCDDCRKPKPGTYIPEGFMAGVTCVWLCRTDLIELHDWHQAPSVPPADTTLMHLLTGTTFKKKNLALVSSPVFDMVMAHVANFSNERPVQQQGEIICWRFRSIDMLPHCCTRRPAGLSPPFAGL